MQCGAVGKKCLLLKEDVNFYKVVLAFHAAQTIRECGGMILCMSALGIALAIGSVKDIVCGLLNYVAHVKYRHF